MKNTKTIAVLGDSGNSGKSTIANLCIFPRLKNNPEIVVFGENNFNLSAKETAHGPVKHFTNSQELAAYVSNASSHDVVVDFGCIHPQKTEDIFLQHPEFMRAFDLFIVPISQQDGSSERETLELVRFFAEQEIPAEKIKLVFTMLAAGRFPQKIFSDVFAAHEQEPNFTLDPAAVMRKTPLINLINGTAYSIQDLLDDKTDYVKKIVDAHPHRDDPEVADKIKEYTWLRHSKGMAITITTEFDKIFASITS